MRRSKAGAQTRQPRRHGSPRPVALGATLALSASLLAACGSDGGSANTLNWYINPDNGYQAETAARCSQQSGGRYTITTNVLPSNADAQREQLIRRLAANDTSIDMMSVDPPYMAEMAEAGYLRPFTEQESGPLTRGMLEGPLETAAWKGQLYGVPLKSNTQLLWYRKSVAQAAGVDPTAENFTWDQMIDAAIKQGKRVDEQGRRYEGYMVWINALVTSAGGTILENAEAGQDAEATIDSPAGRRAAEIIRKLATSSAANPSLSTTNEPQGITSFQSDDGGFMLNWPFIYASMQSSVEDGSLPQSVLDDVAWAPYPRVDADRPAAPPIGGINFVISSKSDKQDLAVEATRCITSLESSVGYLLAESEPSVYGAAYDDPRVREELPFGDLIREGIDNAGVRPVTAYYTDVSSAVQRTWHPPGSVNPGSTPPESATLISDVLNDRRLL